MGSLQVINCTVSTVSGVESSSVMIGWMGSGGNIDATNGRVSTTSVNDDGNNMYIKSLQFTYLMEGDEGTYTSNVMILGTSVSQAVEIQTLTSRLSPQASEKWSCGAAAAPPDFRVHHRILFLYYKYCLVS